MKPAALLRIASVLTVIHALMHTIGGVFGKPMPGTAAHVADVMAANRFPVFGVMRSYADFYLGMGLGVTISLTVEAVLLWQLGMLARKDATRLRPMIATLMFGYLLLAANSYLYFFLAPVIIEILIALCLGAAIVTAKPATNLPADSLPLAEKR